MKKLLVFFHAKGSQSLRKEKVVFIEDIAYKYNADVFYIRAPIEYKDGNFCWYNKIGNSQDAIKEEFDDSIEYAKNKIEEELNKKKLNWEDLILMGYSQGGVVSIMVGLSNKVKGVLTVCACLPYNIDYKKYNLDKNIPVYWFEGKEDNYISQLRKDSYNILLEQGFNIKYKLKEGLSHGGFEVSIKDDL